MYCNGCGYKISDKNQLFNDETFLEKNTERHLIRCPFCGLKLDFLGEKLDLIKYELTLDEMAKKLFRQAMLLEKFNGEFYKLAMTMTEDESLIKLFKSLSNVELVHSKIHQRLGGFESSETLKMKDYSYLDSDKKLLEETERREHHAIKFYGYASSKVKSQSVKELFLSLAEVEKEHQEIAIRGI